MVESALDHHNDSPSLRVIDALATTTGTDPLELDPLYEAVDPEALDKLFQDDSGAFAVVSFEYEGHSVEVRGDGTISVDGTVHEGA